jgi:Lon protease-like protein
MSVRDDLSIMPLNSVLFPGAPASLYVHEQRYREMVARCMAGDGLFGVALLKSGKEVGGTGIPHDIGTLAKIVHVTKLPDDSSLVLARGGPRFRISNITQLSPVVEAKVEVLPEQAELLPADEATVAEARERMHELLTLILQNLGEEEAEPPVPEDPALLSYAIAVHVQAPLEVQQRLLEAGSVATRLEMVLPMLRREISYYRVIMAAKEQREQLGLDDEDESVFSRN